MTDSIRKADLAAEGEPEEEFNQGIAGRLPAQDQCRWRFDSE